MNERRVSHQHRTSTLLTDHEFSACFEFCHSLHSIPCKKQTGSHKIRNALYLLILQECQTEKMVGNTNINAAILYWINHTPHPICCCICSGMWSWFTSYTVLSFSAVRMVIQQIENSAVCSNCQNVVLINYNRMVLIYWLSCDDFPLTQVFNAWPVMHWPVSTNVMGKQVRRCHCNGYQKCLFQLSKSVQRVQHARGQTSWQYRW